MRPTALLAAALLLTGCVSPPGYEMAARWLQAPAGGAPDGGSADAPRSSPDGVSSSSPGSPSDSASDSTLAATAGAGALSGSEAGLDLDLDLDLEHDLQLDPAASDASVPLAAAAPAVAGADAAAPSMDLWDRLRAGYALPAVDHPRIRAERDWYARHPEYLDRVAERGRLYLHHVVGEVEARGMPAELALLPIVESAFDPFAYSHGRAAGLWQFIPGTGRMYGLGQDWWHDQRRDVVESTRAALDYLEDLHAQFDGDWLLALAAYNSGPGNVRRALRRNRNAGRPEDFFSLDLPRETRGYAPKLLAIAELVRNPEAYGVKLVSLPDAPYFTVVDTGSQLDLARAAELTGLENEVIYRLNPALNRWATHPEGPHRLLVPVASAERLQMGLATLAPEQRVAWQRHRIRPGESLNTIARRYGTDVATLQQTNRIRGALIRAGDNLLIPTAAAPAEQYALSSSGRQAQRDERNGEHGEALSYRVVEGDSFWTIARRHRVDMHRLASSNGMAVRDPLRVGQELKIWGSANADRPTLAAAPAREAVTRRLGYSVRSGDSLARIAGRFGVRVSDIVSWNKLNPSRYLQPGQQLTLFVDVIGAP